MCDKNFILWCQKTIPLVFDNSMSYYECLCKLLNYVNSLTTDVKEIAKLQQELKDYVDNYFTNLDVQKEINNKLDEMVNDGTLATIINEQLFNSLDEQINKNEKITFLGNNLIENFGNCAVYQGLEKNGIFDLSYEKNCATLINFLTENNINKIDFIVISHFHDDHIGGQNGAGFITLLNNTNFDFSNLTVYLPHKGISWGSFIGNNYQEMQQNEQSIINFLNQKQINYTYPDNESYDILSDYSSLNFYNTNPSFYNDYYNYLYDSYNNLQNYTNYNNFSMITKINSYKNTIFITGDIEKLAETKNYLYFNQCDVLQIEHHGLNFSSDNNYLSQLNPKIAVVPTGDNLPLNQLVNSTFQNLKNKGTSIYNTQNGNVLITSYFNKINSESLGLKNNIQEINKSLYGGISFLLDETYDLNEMLTPGIYYSRSTSFSEKISNLPKTPQSGAILGNGFKLEIEKLTSNTYSLKQKLTYMNRENGWEFERIMNANNQTWGPWNCITKSPAYYYELQESDFAITGTLTDTPTIIVQNNIVFLKVNFVLNEEIQAYQDFLNLPSIFANSFYSNIPIIAYTSAGEMTTLYFQYSTGKIRTNEVISSGKRIQFTLCFPASWTSQFSQLP